MITLLALIALLFLGLLWYGASPVTTTVSNGPGTPVAFTEIAKGDQSKVMTRDNYLVTTPEQMAKLWSLVAVEGPAPTVDFSKNDVIAVFAGKEPSAGYTIHVTRVTDGAERMVTVELATPGPSCSAARTVTTPFQILLLPKTARTLTHTDIATTTSCSR